jgi:Na+-transporting methylmalonyl-CoA/oxaloacetate decarboxylase gamma subunit
MIVRESAPLSPEERPELVAVVRGEGNVGGVCNHGDVDGLSPVLRVLSLLVAVTTVLFHILISSNPAEVGISEKKEVVHMTRGDLARSGLSASALVIADLCVFVFTTAGPG